MSEIDYSKYTLQEMYEVYAKLDNERDFFEANEIFDEIEILLTSLINYLNQK